MSDSDVVDEVHATCEISIQYFRNVIEKEWEVPIRDLTMVVGNSGIGKTTLFAAIIWVLTGEGSAESLHAPTQRTKVQLRWPSNDVIRTVYRQRRPSRVMITEAVPGAPEEEWSEWQGAEAEERIKAWLGTCWVWRAVQAQRDQHVLLSDRPLADKLALLATIGCERLSEKAHDQLKEHIADSYKAWKDAETELALATKQKSALAPLDKRPEGVSNHDLQLTSKELQQLVTATQSQVEKEQQEKAKREAWADELRQLPEVAVQSLDELKKEAKAKAEAAQAMRRAGEKKKWVEAWLDVVPCSDQERDKHKEATKRGQFFLTHKIYNEQQRQEWVRILEARLVAAQQAPERKRLVYEKQQAELRLNKPTVLPPEDVGNINAELQGAPYLCPKCAQPLAMVGNELRESTTHCAPVRRKELLALREQVEKQKQAYVKDQQERQKAQAKLELVNARLSELPDNQETFTVEQLSGLLFLARDAWCAVPPPLPVKAVQAWSMREEIAQAKVIAATWSASAEEEINSEWRAAERRLLESEQEQTVARRRSELKKWLDQPIRDSQSKLVQLQYALAAVQHREAETAVENAETLVDTSQKTHESWLRIKEAVITAERIAVTDTLGWIQTQTNYILDQLFGIGVCRIKITIEKKEKSGKLKTICQPNITMNGYDYPNKSLLSGGEAARVSLALLLAFAQITGVEFLLLDEPFAGVDVEALERCVQVIKDIRIPAFVICHGPYESYFDQTLTIE